MPVRGKATSLPERTEATSLLGRGVASSLLGRSLEGIPGCRPYRRIFVGGQEAAMSAMGKAGLNPAGITFCVDCRADMGSGRHRTSESFGPYRDGAPRGLIQLYIAVRGG